MDSYGLGWGKWRALVKMVIKMQGISCLAAERSASQRLCSTEFSHALCTLHDATRAGMEQSPWIGQGCSYSCGDVVGLETRICVMNNERSQHTLASDTKFDSRRRCVVGMWPLSKASQGAAHLECNNLHRAIHVSMLHTPYYQPQMRIHFLNIQTNNVILKNRGRFLECEGHKIYRIAS
jgi:hypothetical protein